MDGVAILLKKQMTGEYGKSNAALNRFALCGYAFNELRILAFSDAKKLQATLSVLKAQFENVLLLAEKSLFPTVKACVEGTYANRAQRNGRELAGVYEEGRKSLFLLPAEENELVTDFVQTTCANYLQNKYGVRHGASVLRAVGAGEERVEALLSGVQAKAGDKLILLHTRRYDEDILHFIYDDDTPKMLLDECVRTVVEGLGDTVYAMDDTPLEAQLVKLLRLRKKKLSVAESFTGGGVAKRITSVSGASTAYFEGLNTYDEKSKIKRLNVTEYGLQTVGAVSDRTAYEMALGLLNTGDCDIAIATTGLAGPQSDRSSLPVGLCFIAVGTKQKIFVYRYQLKGNREEITEKAINYALFLAYKQLKDI